MAKKIEKKFIKIIKFHNKLYDIQAIESSINDFYHLGNFNINKEDNYFSVEIKFSDKDMENILPLEFANHVLNETISRRTFK